MAGVSIIIVAWNSVDDLQYCLRSLQEISRLPFPLQTIVVDNASTDGTVEKLRAHEKSFDGIGLSVIYNNANRGLSDATNQAFELAHGDFVLLCNPDITFNESFVEMVAFAQSHPQMPILAAELTESDGRPQRVAIRRFPNVARIFFDFGVVGRHIDKYLLHNFISDDYCYRGTRFQEPAAFVDSPGASFLLVLRRILPLVGGIFSPEFPVWWNDVDFAKRAARVGLPRAVLPSIKVAHGLGQSSKLLPKPLQRFMFCQSMVRYAYKWDMHPKLVQGLFLLDAILGVLVNFPVWARRIGLSKGASSSIEFAAAQTKSILVP